MTEIELSPDKKEFYDLWLLLGQARHLAYLARQRSLTECGVTPRQAAILYVIARIGDAATPAEIARWTGREDHTISSNLNTMLKNGLILKEKHPERKNWIRVTITDQGRQAMECSLQLKVVTSVMSTLSVEERAQFKSLLVKIRQAAAEELNQMETVSLPPFP